VQSAIRGFDKRLIPQQRNQHLRVAGPWVDPNILPGPSEASTVL
jgi:hypothetical protein